MGKKGSSLPRVLIIAGLTASGKTDLALQVSSHLSAVDIISTDSRQFYQGLRIISGQDIPTGFSRCQSEKISFLDNPAVYFQSGDTRIWGVDQLPPDQILNLRNFVDFTWEIINQAIAQGRSVIVVGGTGLYLKAITQPLDRLATPPNYQLRQELELLKIEDLQFRLQKLNPDWLAKLNHSDKNNPRRLIRAIEIALFNKSNNSNGSNDKSNKVNDSNNKSNKKNFIGAGQGKPTEFRWIGLKPNMNTLSNNIKIRVEKRLQQGSLEEVSKLLEKYPANLPALSALGIKHITGYLKEKINHSQLIERWTQQELSYAKSQWTWFKKQPSIIWYDENTDRQKLATSLFVWLTNKNDFKKK